MAQRAAAVRVSVFISGPLPRAGIVVGRLECAPSGDGLQRPREGTQGTEYQKILLWRLDLRGRISALFGTVDLLLAPVHPFAPLTLATIRTLGEQPELIAKLQRHTCPFDMTGHPALTLPGGFSAGGLPIGFQLVAARLGEATLIRAGAAFQAVTSWHRRRPPA
jgi:amidase